MDAKTINQVKIRPIRWEKGTSIDPMTSLVGLVSGSHVFTVINHNDGAEFSIELRCVYGLAMMCKTIEDAMDQARESLTQWVASLIDMPDCPVATWADETGKRYAVTFGGRWVSTGDDGNLRVEEGPKRFIQN